MMSPVLAACAARLPSALLTPQLSCQENPPSRVSVSAPLHSPPSASTELQAAARRSAGQLRTLGLPCSSHISSPGTQFPQGSLCPQYHFILEVTSKDFFGFFSPFLLLNCF